MQGQTPAFVPQTEGWSETLASVSEAVVKAEQMVEDDAATQPAKLEVLQKHTIEVGTWEHAGRGRGRWRAVLVGPILAGGLQGLTYVQGPPPCRIRRASHTLERMPCAQ